MHSSLSFCFLSFYSSTPHVDLSLDIFLLTLSCLLLLLWALSDSPRLVAVPCFFLLPLSLCVLIWLRCLLSAYLPKMMRLLDRLGRACVCVCVLLPCLSYRPPPRPTHTHDLKTAIDFPNGLVVCDD